MLHVQNQPKRSKQLSTKKVNKPIKHNSYSKLVRRTIKHYSQLSSQQLPSSSSFSTTPLFFDAIASSSSPTSISSLCDFDTSASLFTSTIITHPYPTSSFSNQHRFPSRSNNLNHYHNHVNHFNSATNSHQTYHHNLTNRSNLLYNQSTRSFSTSQSILQQPPNIINIDPVKFSYHHYHKSTNNIPIYFYLPNGVNNLVLTPATISLVNDLVSQQIDPLVDQLLTTMYNQDNDNDIVCPINDPINATFLNKFSIFKDELAKVRKIQQQQQQPLPKVIARTHPRFGRTSRLTMNKLNAGATFETIITQQFLDDLLTLLIFTIEYDFLFPCNDENGNRIKFTIEQKEEISKTFKFHFFQQIQTGKIITINDCLQNLIRIFAEAGIGKSVALCRIVPILIKICNIKKIPFLISFDSLLTNPMQLFFEPSSTPTSNDHYFHFYHLQQPKSTPSNTNPTIPLEDIFQYIQPNSIHLYERRDYQRTSGADSHENFQDLAQSIHSILTAKRQKNPNFKCLTTIVSSTPHAFQLEPKADYPVVPEKPGFDLYELPDDEHVHQSQYISKIRLRQPKPAPVHRPFILSKQHYDYYTMMNIVLKESLFTTNQFLIPKSNHQLHINHNQNDKFLQHINQVDVQHLFPLFYQKLIQFSNQRTKALASQQLYFTADDNLLSPVLTVDSFLAFDDSTYLQFNDSPSSTSTSIPTAPMNEKQSVSNPITKISLNEQSTTTATDSQSPNALYMVNEFIQQQLLQLLSTTPTLRMTERILESFARFNVNYDTSQLLLQHIIHLSKPQINSLLSYMTRRYQQHLSEAFAQKPTIDGTNKLVELSSQYDAIMKLSSSLPKSTFNVVADLTPDQLSFLQNLTPKPSTQTTSTTTPTITPNSLSQWYDEWKINTPFEPLRPEQDFLEKTKLLINNELFQQFLFPNCLNTNTRRKFNNAPTSLPTTIVQHFTQQERDFFKLLSTKFQDIFTPIPRYQILRSIDTLGELPTNEIIATQISIALNPQIPSLQKLQEVTPGIALLKATSEISCGRIVQEAIQCHRKLSSIIPFPLPTKLQQYFIGQLKFVLTIDDEFDVRWNHDDYTYTRFADIQSNIASMQFLRCPLNPKADEVSSKEGHINKTRSAVDNLNNGEMIWVMTNHTNHGFDLIIFFKIDDIIRCAIGELKDKKQAAAITLPTKTEISTFFTQQLQGKFDGFINQTRGDKQYTVDAFFLFNLSHKKPNSTQTIDDLLQDRKSTQYEFTPKTNDTITSLTGFSQLDALYTLGAGSSRL